jgi:asparagine synthase (glutamine-hydrolysing)
MLDAAMGIDPAAKMAGPGRMEKHILRKAFADVLPASVAWCRKEPFLDGVG